MFEGASNEVWDLGKGGDTEFLFNNSTAHAV